MELNQMYAARSAEWQRRERAMDTANLDCACLLALLVERDAISHPIFGPLAQEYVAKRLQALADLQSKLPHEEDIKRIRAVTDEPPKEVA